MLKVFFKFRHILKLKIECGCNSNCLPFFWRFLAERGSCMPIGHEYTYKLCMKICDTLTVTNMATARNRDFMSFES